eukprot:gene8198-biopygen9145
MLTFPLAWELHLDPWLGVGSWYPRQEQTCGSVGEHAHAKPPGTPEARGKRLAVSATILPSRALYPSHVSRASQARLGNHSIPQSHYLVSWRT